MEGDPPTAVTDALQRWFYRGKGRGRIFDPWVPSEIHPLGCLMDMMGSMIRIVERK